MTSTNATGESKRFSLTELNDLMAQQQRPPVGFLVSQVLWDSLEARWREETSLPSFGPAPQRLNGIEIAIDPMMPDKEFEVAWSREAWTRRLAEIRAANA